MPNHSYTYDNSLVLKAAGAAVVSSAAIATILDTNNGASGNPSMFRADAVIDVTALDVATGDEEYDIIVQGSNSATFASGVVNLGAAIISVDGIAGSSADDVIGRYILPFLNERNGTIYRYVRLYTLLRAAGSSITYKAFAAIRA